MYICTKEAMKMTVKCLPNKKCVLNDSEKKAHIHISSYQLCMP